MAAHSDFWKHADYRSLLKSKFDERRSRNRGYSLRAFARDLDMTVSSLSLVFSGKRGISVKRAGEIASRLSFTPSECSFFVDLVEGSATRDPARRESARRRVRAARTRNEFKVLEVDYFKAIEDWYHSAIFAFCLASRGSGFDAARVSRRLGVSEAVVREAVDRLKRLEMLEERNGRLVPTNRSVRIGAEVPSQSIRKFHRQILQRAMNALSRDPLERREFSSNVVPIDSRKLPEAKKAVREFALSFIENYGVSDEPGQAEIYGLSVQLFDLLEPEGRV